MSQPNQNTVLAQEQGQSQKKTQNPNQETEQQQNQFPVNDNAYQTPTQQKGEFSFPQGKELLEVQIFPNSNEGYCSVTKVTGLRYSAWNFILGILLTIFTAGIFYVICHQNNKLYKYFFFSKCCVLKAKYYLVENSDGKFNLQKQVVLTDLKQQRRFGFQNRHMMYIFCTNKLMFETINFKIEEMLNNQINKLEPLSPQEIPLRRQFFGRCIIDFDIQSYFVFLYYYCTSPTTCLVYLSIFVWMVERLYFFVVNMIWAIFLCASILYCFLRYSKNKIRQRAKTIISVHRILQGNVIERVQSLDLVPGDFVKIEPGQQLAYDVIVVKGEAFVNECNITGESDPIPKIHLENNSQKFDYKANSESIIYEGSDIISSTSMGGENSHSNLRLNQEVESMATGMVIRTGFSTLKGQVVRQSLYQKQVYQNFQIEQIKFSIVWMGISVIIFAVLIYFYLDQREEIPRDQIWIKLGEGLINFGAPTIIIFNTLSLISGLYRLLRQNIQGVNPTLIANAGQIEAVCFDKTGTITESKVFAKGYWSKSSGFVEASTIEEKIKNNENPFQNDALIQKLFATCHATQPNPNNPQQLLGDAIDIQIFTLSNFQFAEAQGSIEQKQNVIFNVKDKASSQEISVLKRFNFQSQFASMSVVVRDGSKMLAFVKGSPEKLKSLCVPSSVPADFDEILHSYSVQGLRILALTYRELDQGMEGKNLEEMGRHQLENNLVMLGLIVLQNPLKKDSKEVFHRLIQSDLPMKIISGDHNLTVTHTAYELGLFNRGLNIYHFDYDENERKIIFSIQNNKDFAEQEFPTEEEQIKQIQQILKSQKTQIVIKGQALTFLQKHYESVQQILIEQQSTPVSYSKIQAKSQTLTNSQDWADIYNKVVMQGRVFARCSPDQKKDIIIHLKSKNIKVAMVGDGANDCLAIQEANIGISFTNAQAALSSPFCTQNESIDCVEKIIAEGRSTLEINYEISHLYLEQAFIRYIQHLIELFYYEIPSDLQTIYPSYFGGYLLALTCLTFSRPTEYLTKEKLQIMMTQKRSIVSHLGKWIILFVFLLSYHYYTKTTSFWKDPVLEDSDKLNKKGYINSVLFMAGTFQQAVIPLHTYVSAPVKEAFYKTKTIFIATLWNIALAILLFFISPDTIKSLNIVDMPTNFKVNLLLWNIAICVLKIIWEKICVVRISYYDTYRSLTYVYDLEETNKSGFIGLSPIKNNNNSKQIELEIGNIAPNRPVKGGLE